MSKRDGCLRAVIEAWLGRDSAAHIRLTRLRLSHDRRCRYVRVEPMREAGRLAILFFRHDDGSWQVFPPEPRRLVMGSAVITFARTERVGSGLDRASVRPS